VAKEQVNQLLYLLDDAFCGPDFHSLLTNLSSVRPDDWNWVPPNGERPICELVAHVSACKLLYHDQAFDGAKKSWEEIVAPQRDAMTALPTAVEYLRKVHDLLHQDLVALNDDDLLQLRPNHMGPMRETRWIMMITMQHDLYHAGEINHIRALHQHNDGWD
jgi:hypothetical protein